MDITLFQVLVNIPRNGINLPQIIGLLPEDADHAFSVTLTILCDSTKNNRIPIIASRWSRIKISQFNKIT